MIIRNDASSQFLFVPIAIGRDGKPKTDDRSKGPFKHQTKNLAAFTVLLVQLRIYIKAKKKAGKFLFSGFLFLSSIGVHELAVLHASLHQDTNIILPFLPPFSYSASASLKFSRG
jgi:hypothetical protein